MLFTLTIYSYATIVWVWLFLEFTSLNSLSNISRLKSRKSPISKIQVARPGIELRTPCFASHELKHSPTTALFSTIALDKRYVHDAMKHTMRQKEKEWDLTQRVLWRKPLNSTTNWQHKNTTKNFDYTTIADRLSTVGWSNNSHPTGVVKPVYGYPTLPLTTTAV